MEAKTDKDGILTFHLKVNALPCTTLFRLMHC